jgi:hypothetical protein
MALVVNFVKIDRTIDFRSSVECGWTSGIVNGRQILHLETYGSSSREVPGRGSQFLQFDREGARILRSILVDAFPEIDS